MTVKDLTRLGDEQRTTTLRNAADVIMLPTQSLDTNIGGTSTGLPKGCSYLGVDGNELGLRLELELPHPDEVLVDLGEALLASVLQVLREELELFRHPLQGLGVVPRQLAGRR